MCLAFNIYTQSCMIQSLKIFGIFFPSREVSLILRFDESLSESTTRYDMKTMLTCPVWLPRGNVYCPVCCAHLDRDIRVMRGMVYQYAE